MTINTTPKEMPTGDGHPTAGCTINGKNFPMVKHQGKAFRTPWASFALHGRTPHDAALFLTSIGGQA